MITYLEYLKFIFLEFNNTRASKESYLVQFLYKGLKPSIKAQIKQQSQKINNLEEIIEKTINVKAKASILPTFLFYKIN